jgi:hypothetical protein
MNAWNRKALTDFGACDTEHYGEQQKTDLPE